jgi:predicted DNA-binding antitoxin AbrB/MazE fold protein
MTTAVKAIYEDGVFKPKEPVDLQEKTEVEVIIPTPAPADDDDPTGWKTAMELVGCIEDGPEDGAENHDRYIYGYDEEK